MKSTFVLAVLFVTTTAVAQTESSINKPVQSDVYAWKNLQVEKLENAERRRILNGSGPVMSKVEIHASTIDPGKGPRPGNKHEEEVLVIIKEGKVKIRIDEKFKVLGPGSVAFAIPGAELAVENVGDTKASYYIIKYKRKDSVNLQRAVSAGGSFFVDWNDVKFNPHDKGGIRRFFDRPTAMIKRFEMHVTTLNTGMKSHDPHMHRAEEIILMVEGLGEMQIGEKIRKCEPGDLIFLGSNVLHAIKNDDTKPIVYFAFQFD
jgi:(S)-ureidoglycine aminohydrolase